MLTEQLKEYLEKQRVNYMLIVHFPAFTAHDAAAAAHIEDETLASVIMLRVDNHIVMAVLPACEPVNLSLVKQAIGAQTVVFAEERNFSDLLPGCAELPPLALVHGIEVVVAQTLAAHEMIAFGTGSHNELLIMPYVDFERLVHPKIICMPLAVLKDASAPSKKASLFERRK